MTKKSFCRLTDIKNVQVEEDAEGVYVWVGYLKTQHMSKDEANELAKCVREIIETDKERKTVSLGELYVMAGIKI